MLSPQLLEDSSYLFIWSVAWCLGFHSPTRDQIYVSCIEIFGVPTTGLPENFLKVILRQSRFELPHLPHQLILRQVGVVYSKLIVMFFSDSVLFCSGIPYLASSSWTSSSRHLCKCPHALEF